MDGAGRHRHCPRSRPGGFRRPGFAGRRRGGRRRGRRGGRIGPPPHRRLHRRHPRRRRRRRRDRRPPDGDGGPAPMTRRPLPHRPLLRRPLSATGCAQIAYGAAAALGLLADRVWGEPPAAAHPVAHFGRAMTQLERLVWRDSRSAGAGYAAIGVGLGSWAGAGLVRATDAALRRTASTASGRTASTGSGRTVDTASGRKAAAALGRATGFALEFSLPAGAVATWLVVAGRALGEEAEAIGQRLTA